MIEEQLTEYIRTSRQQGKTDEEIRNDLLNAGWQESQLQEAFANPSDSPIGQEGHIILPPFSKLLGRTLAIFRQHFWKLLAISIIPAAISTLPFISVISNLPYAVYSQIRNISTIIGYLLLYFTTLVGALIINSHLGVARAYKESLKLLGPYLWLSVISILIITGGVVAFIIPGIFFSMTFAPAIYVLINNEGRGLDALQKVRGLEKRSNYLTRVIQFIPFVILSFIAIYIAAFISFLSSVYLGIPSLKIFTHANWLFLLVVVLGLIIFYLSYYALSFLTVAYSFVLYERLKISKGRIEADLSDGWTNAMKFLIWVGLVIVISLILLTNFRKTAPQINQNMQSVSDTTLATIDVTLKPYFPKSLKGGLSLLEITKRDEDSKLFRMVDTAEGEKPVSVINGYRGLYGYPGLGLFAKMHVEQTAPDKFEEGKTNVIDSLRYITKSDQYVNKETYRGYEIYSADNRQLDSGSPLGMTLVFFPENRIITTIYFINEKPENRKYQTIEQYLELKKEFIQQIIDSVAASKSGG